jgi:hypothetical protein
MNRDTTAYNYRSTVKVSFVRIVVSFDKAFPRVSVEHGRHASSDANAGVRFGNAASILRAFSARLRILDLALSLYYRVISCDANWCLTAT